MFVFVIGMLGGARGSVVDADLKRTRPFAECQPTPGGQSIMLLFLMGTSKN
jgi:hypothetical protein